MALVMSGVPAAVAQQPPEFITIPDSWWFSTTEDYSLMGKEYRVRFYEDTESPDRTAIPVVTMLPDPTNPFQEVALSDEDELHAIALYALWRYYDRAYFRIDWWRHAELWQVIADTNDPAKMQRINFVLTSGKILFDLGLDMLFPLKVPKGLAQLQALGRLISITAELLELIESFAATPDDNQLQAAIQASIDLDPSQLLTLDAQFDVRKYLTRQRLEDTAPLEVIDLYITALELRHFRNLTINVRGDTTTITVALKHPQSWIRAATILPKLVINRQLDGLQANAQAAVVSNQFHATVNVALANALTGELAALSDPSLSPAELEAHVLRIEKLGFDFYWVAYEMMAVYLHYMRVIDSHGWVQQWVTPPKEALAEMDQNVRFWEQSAKNAEVAIARIDNGYQHFLTLNYPDFAGAAAPSPETGVPGSIKELAFVTDRDGNYDLYLVNSDGSNLRRLTSNPGDDIEFAWSPDGNQIAFSCKRMNVEYVFDICVMDADGTNLRALTADSMRGGRFPTWSPDGSQIAFMSFSDLQSNWDIYVIRVDGSNLRRLTDETGEKTAEDGSPVWSPDGGWIAFV
ncbi:MAG: PD40 domain-containing protein, partial [Chloroflexota bacterium]